MRTMTNARLDGTPHGMTMRLTTRLLSLLALWLIPAMAAWGAAGAAPQIEERVTSFLIGHVSSLGRDIEITVHSSSARLPNCIDPQPFLTNPEQRLYGRVSVGLRCGELGEQTRYLQANVSVLVDHVVTAREVEAGAPLIAADLTLAEARLERLPRHALLSVDEAIGLTAARPLRTGTTLQTHYLRRPQLVSRGDHVTVTAHGTGFSVSRKAKALDSGALGDEIRLSTDNGERLIATVTGPNQLKVTL